MIDPFAIFQQLVIPAGAQPGSPRIVLGPIIPPELVAWGAANSVVFYAIVRYESDATHYTWEGIGLFAGQVTKFEGTYDPVNTVYITLRTLLLAPPGGVGSINTRIGSSALNTFQNQWDFQQTQVFFNPDASLTLGVTSPFVIDNVSQGRGRLDFVSSDANTAALAAETVVLTGNTKTFWPVRAYEVLVGGATFASVASSLALYIIRRTNLAGTILQNNVECLMSPGGNSLRVDFRIVLRNATALPITDNLVLTLAPNVGTVTMLGAADRPRSMEIRDIGAASDYPLAVQI